MNTSQVLTSRRPLDRTVWHMLRCTLGFHVAANWERVKFTIRRKEGRKHVEFEAWFDAREAICCGKTLNCERLV